MSGEDFGRMLLNLKQIRNCSWVIVYLHVCVLYVHSISQSSSQRHQFVYEISNNYGSVQAIFNNENLSVLK